MMKLAMPLALSAALALSACATAPLETPSRAAAATGSLADTTGQSLAPRAPLFKIESVRVTVPRSLRVSERNSFYPGGDIVWREDAPGDRHLQVARIVEDAMLKGVRGLGTQEGVPAVLDIEVTRFHALTEKARYTIGGVHALQFIMTLRDPETGEPFGEPKFVKADFKALGGSAAVRAEQAGLTQKARITEHLAGVIQHQLTDPENYQAAKLGLMGALNQF